MIMTLVRVKGTVDQCGSKQINELKASKLQNLFTVGFSRRIWGYRTVPRPNYKLSLAAFRSMGQKWKLFLIRSLPKRNFPFLFI